MGGKDKRQRRSEKKFATLEAQFTKLNAPTKSPAHGPARSPALVPVKLSRVLAPIELLSGDILARIAAFVNKAPKETIKLFSTFSRPLFIAVESARYHHDLSVEACLRDAIDRTLAKRVASAVAPTPNAAAVVAASPPGSPKMSAFDALEGSQDVDLLFRASVALLRHRRSLLYQHYRKGNDWDPIGQEWILKCVASGRLPLATVEAGTGRTLLHIALLLGERLLVNKLIQAAVQSTAGFNPWVQDALKRTVLHVAAAEGLTDSVLVILHQVEPGRMEAYGNLQTLNKRTAAEEATHHRHTKLAAALVEALRAAHYNDDDEEDGDDYDDGCEDDDYYAA